MSSKRKHSRSVSPNTKSNTRRSVKRSYSNLSPLAKSDDEFVSPNNKNTNNKNTNANKKDQRAKYRALKSGKKFKTVASSLNSKDSKFYRDESLSNAANLLSKSKSMSTSSSSLDSGGKNEIKEQETFQTVIPYASFEILKYKKDLHRAIEFSEEHTNVGIKLRELKISKSDKNESEEKDKQALRLNEEEQKLQKQKQKICNKLQTKLLLSQPYFMLRYTRARDDAACIIHNIIDNENKKMKEPGKIFTTVRSLKVSDLVRYSIELRGMMPTLVAIKQNGKDSASYKDLLKAIDVKVRRKLCSIPSRGNILFASAIIIKFLQNTHNKFKYDLSAEFEKIQIGHLKEYEPERFELEYEDNIDCYLPLRTTEGKKPLLKDEWDTLKQNLIFADTEEKKDDEEEEEIIPSVSVSIEPYVS